MFFFYKIVSVSLYIDKTCVSCVFFFCKPAEYRHLDNTDTMVCPLHVPYQPGSTVFWKSAEKESEGKQC